MDILDALASVARYNGWNDVLHEIRNYLIQEVNNMKKTKVPYWNVPYPEFLNKYDVDLYPRVIWFVMVEMFGDCGCSPRFGWIEKNKSNDAIEFISQLCLKSDEPQED